ncbi:Putative F-box protein [Morus notabilis]|uniref:Putative F-box protein n=1 Tax=Morus notabilis TaxID=981085 RepID=W9RWX6_9ROSA|nr:F-box/kelch-repeat protein At3g06240 [Morus notabilis]EXB75668.1 Putative F-box protein [Morus notabilis]
MVSFRHIPDRIVDDIISRLPGESIVEFKSVNRSWCFLLCALINNREFVEKQFRNTKDKSTVTLIFDQSPPDADYSHKNNVRFSLLTLTIDNGKKKNRFVPSVAEELNLPPFAKEGGNSWVVACHCDGIVCLVDRMHVMVCNPVMKEFKLLRESRHANKTTKTYSGIGFGYDSNAKDYKFVRVMDCSKALAEIYTLGKESWRDISMPENIVDIRFLEVALYLKGVCYWAIEMKDDHKMMILSFDVSDEVFHVIPFPENLTMPWDWLNFCVWNGSLALFLCHKHLVDTGDRSVAFEIFVMADYSDVLNGATPWIKTLAVRPQLGSLKPLAFWNSEEILMKAKGGRLCSYNIRTEKVRNIGFRGAVNAPVCFYERTLVPLRKRCCNVLN